VRNHETLETLEELHYVVSVAYLLVIDVLVDVSEVIGVLAASIRDFLDRNQNSRPRS
jgi:hypothetical protein